MKKLLIICVVGVLCLTGCASDKRKPEIAEGKPVIVQDNKKPIFQEFKESFEFTEGDKPNKEELLTKFSVKDESKTTIDIDDSGVKYSIPGTYTATVKTIDEYKNETVKDITIVIKKTKTETPEKNKTTEKDKKPSKKPSSNTKPSVKPAKKTGVPEGKKINIKYIGYSSLDKDYGEFNSVAKSLYDGLVNGNKISAEIVFKDAYGTDVYGKTRDFLDKFYTDINNGEDTGINGFGMLITSDRERINEAGVQYDEKVVFSITDIGVENAHNIATINKSFKKIGLHNGMSEKQAVIKINDWICNHLTYKHTNGDYIDALKTGYGVCEEYADIFKLFCDMAGIECRYVEGYIVGSGEGHAWNKVKLNGSWYYVDSCWNDGKEGRTKYFLSKTLWSNHKIG